HRGERAGEAGAGRDARRGPMDSRLDGLKPRHIVAIPSWYKSARGSGGGCFRDQAVALQAAGYRCAMLAPDIYTLRDLRQRQAPPGRGHVRVEDDGIPT